MFFLLILGISAKISYLCDRLSNEYFNYPMKTFCHTRFWTIVIICSICGILLTGCHTNQQTQADEPSLQQLKKMQKRGTKLRNHSLFGQAIATHDSCITLASMLKDTTQLIIALNNQGTNYRRLGAMKEATDFHNHALLLCRQFSDVTSYDAKKNRVRSLNGLGNILLSVGDYESAEQSFREALQGETELGSAVGQAINLANIGSIKKSQGQLDSARIYYSQSMEKNREEDNIIGISFCYTYLGELDEKDGNTDKALANFRLAYANGRKTEDVWHWLNPCRSLSHNFLNKGQLDSASLYINIGIEAAENIHSIEHLAIFYGLLSQLEERQGLSQAALRDLQISSAYNDSVQTQANVNHIQNSRINYEIQRRLIDVRKAEEMAHQEKLIRYLILAASGIILMLIFLVAWLMLRSWHARLVIEEEKENFYRNVTHQLRTPLTVVLGMVEQLKEHIPADDKRGLESLAAAQRQSRNLLELVKKLIEASKEGTKPELTTLTLTSSGEPAATATVSHKNDAKTTITNADEPNGFSVLLAEDNDDVAMLICNLLSDHGYRVTRAADGHEALEMLNDDIPDLLITDIAMPRMDGLELMRHIRKDVSMSHLPIIVASARVEDHERMEGIEAGAEVYLTKPFIPEELLLRIAKILEQRNCLRQRFSQAIGIDSQEMNSGDCKETDGLPLTEAESEFLTQLNKCIDELMPSGNVGSIQIADKMNTSTSTLNRRLKNLTGLSSTLYIRNRRLALAKHLLKETNKPISEIECLCGFNTPGHFSRLFKSEIGISPSEFRRY